MLADDVVRPRPPGPVDGEAAHGGETGISDEELLRAFVARRDHEAFRALVERYTPIVFTAARRQLRGDTHLAEDVTQAVFILLARRAVALCGRGSGMLGGWLVKAARLSAQAAARSELRRKRREERATIMTPTAPNVATPSADAARFEESVDEALCRLGEKDRAAITLRYLQGKSQREVAQAMGVSEAAAAQRLSRALAKLRRFFVRRSELLSLAPAGLETMLGRLRPSPPPPGASGMARAAADAALLPPDAAAVAAPVAVTIAASVLGAMYWKSLAAVAAAVLLAITLTVSGAFMYHARSVARQTNVPAAATAIATAAAARVPIHVGVFVSATTGLDLPPERNAWFVQFRITEELADAPDLQIVPLIEPGTAEQPTQKQWLASHFPGAPPVAVTSAAALRGLDVIVASCAHDVPPPVLDAIEGAVRSGIGLYIRGCLGGCKPGFTNAAALHLRGYTAGIDGIARKPLQCEVINDHPILGSLTISNDDDLMLQPVSCWGPLVPDERSVPLIRLKSLDQIRTPEGKPLPPQPKVAGDVLYLSGLGRGRICCNNLSNKTPKALEDATGNHFVVRVVRWLAGRPLD